MKDFSGKDLAIGDEVVMIVPNYRSLTKATVVRFTNQFVVVQYLRYEKMKEIRQDPRQLIKV